MVFLACPPPKMDHQPLSWALCGCGSDHCYSVTVLIVGCLSDPAVCRVGRCDGGVVVIHYVVEPVIGRTQEIRIQNEIYTASTLEFIGFFSPFIFFT